MNIESGPALAGRLFRPYRYRAREYHAQFHLLAPRMLAYTRVSEVKSHWTVR